MFIKIFLDTGFVAVPKRAAYRADWSSASYPSRISLKPLASARLRHAICRNYATSNDVHASDSPLASSSEVSPVKFRSRVQKAEDSRPRHAVVSAFDLFSIGIGPSSSHTLGPWRAARIFVQSLRDVNIFNDVFQLRIDLYGSLAATGKGHMSHTALMCGFMDEDPETMDTGLVLPKYEEIKATKKLIFGGTRQIDFDLSRDMVWHFDKTLERHSNGMTFAVFSREGDLIATNTYFSIGGGFVVNAAQADSGENLYYKQIKKEEASPSRRELSTTRSTPPSTPQIEGEDSANDAIVVKKPTEVKIISEPPLLFSSAATLLEMCKRENMTIAQVVWENERHQLQDNEIRTKLLKLWSVMDDSIHRGVTSTESHLPGPLKVRRRAKKLYDKLARGFFPPQGQRSSLETSLQRAETSRAPVLGRLDHPLPPIKPRRVNFPTMDILTCYAIAVNECNAAGERIVVAPTNGASGTLPAVLKYLLEFISEDPERDILTFLLTASAVGSLFKRGATLSAAEGGCQAEVGVACSMAAAGFAACLGGSPAVVEHAAEIAIEHNLGLTCDPPLGLVMIPCRTKRSGSCQSSDFCILSTNGGRRTTLCYLGPSHSSHEGDWRIDAFRAQGNQSCWAVHVCRSAGMLKWIRRPIFISMPRLLTSLPREVLSLLSLGVRRASTAALPRTEIPLTPHLRLSIALNRLRSFYESEYPSRDTWIKRLDWAKQDLSTRRRTRVTLLGDNNASSLLLSALLSNPLSDNLAIPKLLQEAFHSPAGETLRIKWAEKQRLEDRSLYLTSDWLRDNDAEFLLPAIDPLNITIDLDALYQTDLVLILANSVSHLREMKQVWLPLIKRPSTVLVTLSPEIRPLDLQRMVGAHVEDQAQPQWTMLPLDVVKLQQSLGFLFSPDAAKRSSFSSSFGQSGMLTIEEHLRLASNVFPDPESVARLQTTLFTAESAAQKALRLALAEQEQARTVQKRLTSVQHKLEQDKKGLSIALNLSEDGKMRLSEDDSQEGRNACFRLFSKKLTWWKLPLGRADDVYADLQQASLLFCRRLENKLAYEAGKLEVIRQNLDCENTQLLGQPPFLSGASDKRAFSSTVLVNQAQQVAEKAGTAMPHSLAAPIITRREALVAPGGPVEHLQIRAQWLTLQSYALVGGFSALGYLSFISGYLNFASASGLTLFGTLLGAYRLQGGWKRGQNQFLQNYDRLESNMQYDLQQTATQVLDRKVFGKATLLANGLQGIALTRNAEAEARIAEIATLSQELEAVFSDIR